MAQDFCHKEEIWVFLFTFPTNEWYLLFTKVALDVFYKKFYLSNQFSRYWTGHGQTYLSM